MWEEIQLLAKSADSTNGAAAAKKRKRTDTDGKISDTDDKLSSDTDDETLNLSAQQA